MKVFTWKCAKPDMEIIQIILKFSRGLQHINFSLASWRLDGSNLRVMQPRQTHRGQTRWPEDDKAKTTGDNFKRCRMEMEIISWWKEISIEKILMEKNKQTIYGRQRRWILAKVGLSSINNAKLVCFSSTTGITRLVERVKARVSTSHDSSQAFPSTISFDITVQGSTVWMAGFLSFLM